MRSSPDDLVAGWLVLGLAILALFLAYVGGNELLGGPHGIAWVVAPL